MKPAHVNHRSYLRHNQPPPLEKQLTRKEGHRKCESTRLFQVLGHFCEFLFQLDLTHVCFGKLRLLGPESKIISASFGERFLNPIKRNWEPTGENGGCGKM